MLDTTAWKVDDPQWVEKREQDWLETGAPLVGHMYNLGGDLNPHKADAIKKYFLTGSLGESSPFPFYYRIRFYPGGEEEFIGRCLQTATDLEIGRYVVMYTTFNFGKHDKSFAKLFFSGAMSNRLEKLRDHKGKSLSNRRQTRDWGLVSEIFTRWRRILGGDMQAYSPHYYDYLEDRCLELACTQENRTRSEQQQFMGLLEELMQAVVEFAEPLGLPGENTESKQKYDHLYEFFEARATSSKDLEKLWNDAKKLSHIQVEEYGYGAEDLHDRLIGRAHIASPTSEFRTLLEKLQSFFSQTGLCSSGNWLGQFARVEIDDLFSDGAIKEFGLPSEPMQAFHSVCTIDHRVLSKTPLAGILPIHIFVIPVPSMDSFERAAVLVWPENHPVLRESIPPGYIYVLYESCLRWCRQALGAKIFSVDTEARGEYFSPEQLAVRASNDELFRPWLIADANADYSSLPASAISVSESCGAVSLRDI